MNKKDKEKIIQKLQEATNLIEFYKSVDNNDMIFRLCLHKRNLIKQYYN